MKVRQFIADALMEIGILGADETLDAADADLGLRHMQGMVDLFQADRLLLYVVSSVGYPLTPSKGSYSIGPTGTAADLVGARPLWVTLVTVTPVGTTVQYPVHPYVYRASWLAEPDKTIKDVYPSRYYYEPLTATTGLFYFWPIPTTAATVVISQPVPLNAPLTLDTDLTFPPGGFLEAWRINLAKRLERPFQVPEDPGLRLDAEHALAQIRRLNDEVAPLSHADEAVVGNGGYDIRSGWYR